MEKTFRHFSVMAQETVNALNPDGSDKIFIDATLGGGGHSKLIAQKISPKGRLISFDVDIDAISHAKEEIKGFKNVEIIHDSYTNLKNHLHRLGIEKISGGIVFDLGASYHQLTAQERGFSFLKDAKLDMRFDKNAKLSAWDVVNKYKEGDLVRIFSEYGEEHFSKRIAHAIVQKRPINTTLQLAELIKTSTPPVKSKIHCATRVFQALRIEVNGELTNFKNTLNEAVHLLNSGAIISILTFHSLEDRIAKNILKEYSKNCRCTNNQPICTCSGKILELVNKKPITASDEEIKNNPPSRSAKLRIAKKIKDMDS